jgi:hypothetical protein
MYMAQKCFIIFGLFTEAACESQVALLHIFFSRLFITSGFPLAACEFLWRILRGRLYKQIPQAAKENPFVMRKRLRKPACDARTAKGKPRKQITSGFSELSANYAVFSAMCIKILSSNIKITTK